MSPKAEVAGGSWDSARFGRVAAAVSAVTVLLAVPLSFLAEAYCIQAVVSGTPIKDSFQIAVIVGGSWLIGGVAYVVAFMLAMRFTGAGAWIYGLAHRRG